jgi:dipeptidyl-peptidase-2/lysosomal Pro-X carboxypeptidase
MFLRTLIFNSLIAKLATGQDVGPCNYKTLAQSIDHFGASNETFQQRYSYFDEFYKPGGPIMFFQGEEGNGDCAVSASRG